jgi:hypothetical protein
MLSPNDATRPTSLPRCDRFRPVILNQRSGENAAGTMCRTS